jgi:O-antigen/teichoic acid export membrane protein
MMVVNLAAYPLAVAAADAADRPVFEALCRRHLSLLLGLAVPAGVGLAVLAPGIAVMMFGSEIGADAAVLMPIIAAAVLLGGIKAFYFDLSFQLGRATRQQLAVVLVAASTNLLLNLLWIPRMGALGAALATLCAYAGGLVLSVVLGRRVLPLPVSPGDALRILLCVAGMAAVLLPGRRLGTVTALAFHIVGGALVYLILVLLVNPLDSRAALVTWWASRRKGAAS